METRFLVRETTPRPLDVEPQTSLREVESTASQTCPQGEKNKIAEDTGYTQDGSGGVSDGVEESDHRIADSDTICSSRERERRSGTQRHNGSITGSTTDNRREAAIPLVDVDAPKPIRVGRAKPYWLEKNPVTEGTWIDYWMWLCRPNPHDTEPKPMPLRHEEYTNEV